MRKGVTTGRGRKESVGGGISSQRGENTGRGGADKVFYVVGWAINIFCFIRGGPAGGDRYRVGGKDYLINPWVGRWTLRIGVKPTGSFIDIIN